MPGGLVELSEIHAPRCDKSVGIFTTYERAQRHSFLGAGSGVDRRAAAVKVHSLNGPTEDHARDGRPRFCRTSAKDNAIEKPCLLYTSPSPRD